MSPILITGGAGFLGSHLADRLLSNHQEVICLDNLSTGNKSNLRHQKTNKNLTFIAENVENPMDFKVSRIFNLACPASPVAYQRQPISTIQTAILGAINTLQLGLENKARVFQASTSEIYGNPHVHPQREDYCGYVNPIGLRACYDEGKRAAETLFFDYNRQHGVDIRVGRIFNTYGPRMQLNDGRVVSNLIVQAIKNHPITIYGDGQQTRSFCYVDDLLDGILGFVEQTREFGPVNIGNPHEVSIHEFADTVCYLVGSKSLVEFKPLPEDDPIRRRPDIEKLKNLTGWFPKISREDGLKETISYFRRKIYDE